MKLLDVPLARSLWLFDLARVNSKGRSLIDIFHAIAQRYRFPAFPKHLMDVNKENALGFNSGTFLWNGLDLRVGFQVYNNGISVDSLNSTQASDAFMEDLAGWLATEHDIHIKPELKHKSYLSQLHVKAKAVLPLWNPKLSYLSELISKQFTTVDAVPHRFEYLGMVAWPLDAGQLMAPQPFRLDPKWGSEPAEAIYYSQAQLQTDAHLQLLERIEDDLLSSQSPAGRSEKRSG